MKCDFTDSASCFCFTVFDPSSSKTTTCPAVDIKCELFADGRRHASGYVVILSGWNNSKSIIARRDEHGPERNVEHFRKLAQSAAADAKGVAERQRDNRDMASRAHRGKMNHVYAMRIDGL